MKTLRRFSLPLWAGAVTLFSSKPLWACAVCYGDPNSAMTKGANAGILILLGVVVVVLGSVVGVALFWVRRARLYQQGALVPEMGAPQYGVGLPEATGNSL